MESENPICYGLLDKVFPMGENGLRETPETCMMCSYKTECLKKAMARNDGDKVREEMVDRAYESGMIGFLERWSKKKALHRRQKEKPKA